MALATHFPRHDWPGRCCWSPLQSEHHIDVCFYLNRLAFPQKWGVSPLPYCIHSRLLQHRWTGEHIDFVEDRLYR
jgi:hypothetical protein